MRRRAFKFGGRTARAAVLALAMLVTGPLAAAADEAVIVQGNRRVEADTVRSYVHASANGRYDTAALDAAIKALTASGLFDDVSVRRTAQGIVVNVREARLIGRVAFEGNKKLKDEQLAAAVQSKARGPLQRATVQEDVNRIVDAYRHVGRDEVKVRPEIIDRGNDSVDLVFSIVEGGKTTVRRISFSGNHAFSDRQLRAVIETSASNLLTFITHADVYDPDRTGRDQEKIRAYYRDHGYADAAVAEPRVEYDPGSKGFVLGFAIDEGEAYRFGTVALNAAVPGLDAEGLRGRLSVRSGASFDAALLDRSADALAAEMSRRGHPFAQAVPRTVRDAAAHRIDVVFDLKDGPRRYVERVDIHGNSRTRDYVIRREFDFAEGDAYNQTLIDRAERRLKALNYFKSVRIVAKPGSSSDRVVLDVEAADQSTGDFSVSGGYSTSDGWLGEVKIGDRNFLGTGDAVQAAVSYGQYARGFDVSLVHPGWLDTRAIAGIELFARQSFPSSYQSYGTDSYGANLSVTTPLNEQTSVQWRYSLANQDVTLSPTAAGTTVSLPIQQAAAAGPAWVSAAGTTTTYSTLDNGKMPTSGVNSQLRQDLAGLGGDVRFLRTTEDLRYYHSINDDVVALVRGQGGYITGWGGQSVPLLNSFFGGPSLVRGFAPSGFGPRDLTAGSTMDNVGGSLYFATTAELRSGIPGVPDEYGLKASAFVDSGSVFRYTGPISVGGQSVNVADRNVIRSSVGVGLTWASPFGALTASYAVPVTKAAFDQTQPFNFSASPF